MNYVYLMHKICTSEKSECGGMCSAARKPTDARTDSPIDTHTQGAETTTVAMVRPSACDIAQPPCGDPRLHTQRLFTSCCRNVLSRHRSLGQVRHLFVKSFHCMGPIDLWNNVAAWCRKVSVEAVATSRMLSCGHSGVNVRGSVVVCFGGVQNNTNTKSPSHWKRMWSAN